MGASHTYKYQLGKTYALGDTLYDAVFSTTEHDSRTLYLVKKKYDYPIVRKDLGAYTILVPVAPSMTVEDMDKYKKLLVKYKKNWKKLRG